MPLITPPIKNIKEVTEPLKEQILKGDVHTIDEMRAWLKPLGYSYTINEAVINFILREFVMSKVSSDSMMDTDMVVELLHRNNYIDDKQYQSIYADCEELVKLLVYRCKKIDEQLCEESNNIIHQTSDIRHFTGAGSYQGLS